MIFPIKQKTMYVEQIEKSFVFSLNPNFQITDFYIRNKRLSSISIENFQQHTHTRDTYRVFEAVRRQSINQKKIRVRCERIATNACMHTP